MRRRRVLSLTAGGLSIALAGCFGGDDEGDDDDNDENVNETTDDEDDGSGTAPFGGRVEGTSQGGVLALGESTESDARENGFDLPAAEEGDDPVVFEATVDGDGQWEASDVGFEPIPVTDPIEGEIEVELPDGLAGELDPEGERMTATGDLVATVTTGDDELGTIDFEIDATTGESGELAGDADFEADPARVTLVDNEFEVEESGSILIDQFAGLPTESGENWFELELTLEEA